VRQLAPLGTPVAVVWPRSEVDPPHYVKADIEPGKKDAADAEALCEAVTRPSMRFVPVKSKRAAGGLHSDDRAGASGQREVAALECVQKLRGRVRQPSMPVASVHPKAMPVLLTTHAEIDLADRCLARRQTMQRPLPHDTLRIIERPKAVARCPATACPCPPIGHSC